MMSNRLCKFEIEILRECAGDVEPRPWGASVGAALEYLHGSGYIDDDGLTDRGRDALLEANNEE
jgi:hypothetical protein